MDKRAKVYIEMHGGHVGMQIYLPTDIGFGGEVAIQQQVSHMFDAQFKGTKVGQNSRNSLEELSNAYIGLLYLLVRLDIT